MRIGMGMVAFICMGWLLAGLSPVLAEDEAPEYGWKNELVGSINVTQASFDNWQQGGEDMVA